MKKKFTFYFLLLSICCLPLSNLFGQNSRLPSAEELTKKTELEKKYKAGWAQRQEPGAQHLMITGPEQDCDNAIPVCQQSYTQSNSYTGHGTIQEVSGTCLSSQETNSVWYTFTVQNSGTFSFLLNTANDYDFALYDITTIGCVGVPTSTPIRCNYSATYGSTGLTLPVGSNAANGIPASGSPTMPGLNVTAGQTFVLIIDNYSANSNGYSLTFGGTASIFDQTPPSISSIVAPCTIPSVTLVLSEPVNCASIASNGSDFIITGPGGISIPVTNAVGNLCSTGASTTTQIVLTYNNAIMPTGTYTVSSASGVDGNTLLDKCGNVMSTGINFTFNHLGPLAISASSASICAGNSSVITVTGGTAGATFSWAPQSGTDSVLTVSPIANTTYNATVTFGGCSSSISQAIAISSPPIVSVNPSNVSLCSGTTSVSASATMNGTLCTNCDFVWTGGASQIDNNTSSSTLVGIGAGTYSVTVTSSTGCVGNTATSNVSILSPTSLPACDILYVSPAGGGTGVSPSSPTTIQTALTMAACNNAVIKMQIGDYTINNPLSVSSFVTIEGGYNTTFTQKTSAKGTSGGFPGQGTRIIRSTSNPEGVVGNRRLTAFDVVGGSSYFRFQDLIILVNNPAAGSKISNYGIYLGTGCSDYNIVRCIVDAGTGSAGTNGSAGSNGATGSNGSQPVSPYTSGGAGGAGAFAGGTGGNGSTGGNNHTAGANGGGGTPGTGGARATGGDQGDCWGYLDINTPACNGSNGGNGAVGANGAAGTNGVAGSYSAGYFAIGSDGLSGANGIGGNGGGGGGGGNRNTSGCSGPTDGTGGSGGGGGGFPGTGGTGGTAAGGAFAIFSVAKGANSNVIDCNAAAVAGNGGTGGTGGTGGNGGTGATSGVITTGSFPFDQSSGAGGAGGNGGKGGNGGSGGTGANGQSCLVCDLVGTTLNTVVFSNFALAAQPTITVDNISCTDVNISHSTAAGAPVWSSFGLDASPVSGSGSPSVTTYTTTGRKTVVMNANTYTDFNNIITTQPLPGAILASATSICPDTAFYSASAVGTPGFAFSWSVSPSTGVTIINSTSANTGIVFPNATSSPIDYTVSLQVSTLCCGNLTPLTQTITVYPIPAAPTINDTTVCTGGAAVLTATAPIAGSFAWYAAATGGLSINTGATYSVNPVNNNQTYYLESINSGGCIGPRVPVNITINAVSPPSAIDVTVCEPGTVQVGATSVSGATVYNWYDDASGTTLLQSGPSLIYGVDVLAQGGSITVYVSDSVPGCNESVLIPVVASVSNNPILADTIYSTNDTVCAGTSVNISVNVTGGSGSYTYLWSPNGETSSSISIPSAANSTAYSVIVSDGACSKFVSTPLIVGSNATPPSIFGSNSICAGDSIYLYTNLVAGATYNWTAPLGVTLTTHDTVAVVYPATVTDGGNYTLFVDDGSLCPSSSIPFAVSVNAAPNVLASGTTACEGTTVSISASGADTYSWSSGLTPTGVSTADVVVAGTVTYTVTGTTTATGCSDTTAFTVTANSLPVISVNSPNVCLGSSTTLTATGTDSYVWSTTETTSSISVTPSSVGTSTYTVVGTNTLTTCSSLPLTATVTAVALPVVSASALPAAICQGSSTTITANGATSYLWSTTATSSSITESPTQTTVYSVTGTDNGCSASTSVTVTVNSAPTILVNSPTICNGSVANLTANGADTYVWESGITSTGVNTATVSPTGTLTYSVVGTNTLTTCSNDTTFTVTVNNLPTVVANPVGVCLGSTAVLNASGADTYLWSTTETTSSINVVPSSAGVTSYTVVGTNTLTTCSISVTVNVNATALPNVAIVASPSTICSGASSTLTASGATSYVWSTTATSTSINVSPSSTIGYTVTGTDNGCSSQATVTVTVNQSPVIGNTPSIIDATCNLNNGSISPTVSGGTPSYTYSWLSLPGNTNVGSGANLNGVAIGQYQLTVTDANSCSVTSSVFNVANGGAVNAQFTTDVNGGVVPLTVNISNTSTGGNSYQWNFGNGQTSTQQNPVSTVYNSNGSYTISLVVTNGTCYDTAKVVIVTEIPSSITIPNIFSPNGDGINEQFTILSIGLKTMEVDIFNRWGSKVARIEGVGQSWDGKLQNGDPASEGTYFYMLKATGLDGKDYDLHGAMMLVK